MAGNGSPKRREPELQDQDPTWESIHAAISHAEDNNEEGWRRVLGLRIIPTDKGEAKTAIEGALKSRKDSLQSLGKGHVAEAQSDWLLCFAAAKALLKHVQANGNGRHKKASNGGAAPEAVKDVVTRMRKTAVRQVPQEMDATEEERPTGSSRFIEETQRLILEHPRTSAALTVSTLVAAGLGTLLAVSGKPEQKEVTQADLSPPSKTLKLEEGAPELKEKIKLPPSTPFDPTMIEPKPMAKPAPVEVIVPPVLEKPVVLEPKPEPKPQPKPESPAAEKNLEKPAKVTVNDVPQGNQATKPSQVEKSKPTKVAEENMIEKSKMELEAIRKLEMNPKELLGELGKTHDPVQKYAICMVAIEKAKAQADISSLRAAFSALRNFFQNEDSFLSLESKTIIALARTVKNSDRLTEWALALMLEACREGQHDIAVKLGKSLSKALPPKNTTNARRTLGAALKEAQVIQKQYEDTEVARKTLESNPNDPAANLAVGMYLLDVASPAALDHLAKSNGEMCALASKTLQRDQLKAQELLELARKWSAVPGALTRAGVVNLIVEILSKAQQKAEEEGGITGKMIQRNANELKSQHCNKTSVLLQGTSLNTNQPMRTVDMVKWLGQLSPMDQRNLVSHDGRGSLQPGVAIIGNEKVTTLQAKSNVRLSCPDLHNVTVYSVRVIIVPQGKNDSIHVNLPIGETSVTLLIDGIRGELNFFDNQDRPTLNDVERKPEMRALKIGQEYLLDIQVNEGGRPEETSIRIFFSEKDGGPKLAASLKRETRTLSPAQSQFKNKHYFSIMFGGDYALPEFRIQLPR